MNSRMSHRHDECFKFSSSIGAFSRYDVTSPEVRSPDKIYQLVKCGLVNLSNGVRSDFDTSKSFEVANVHPLKSSRSIPTKNIFHELIPMNIRCSLFSDF